MAPLEHASPAAIIGTTSAFTAIGILAVLFRLLTRFTISHNAGPEDVAIFVAIVASIGVAVTNVLQVHYGFGLHFYMVHPYNIPPLLKAIYANIIVYNVALSATKASILLQYWRIFVQRSFRIACTVLSIAVFVYTIAVLFSSIFLCVPIAAVWDPTISPSQCQDRKAVWYGHAVGNIVTDVAMALLPLPYLGNLQISRRQKIVLCIIFAMGGFTCIVSILRLASSAAGIGSSRDPTWEGSMSSVWSTVEVNTAILCSCLPTLKGLMSRVLPHAFSSYQISREQGSSKRTNPEDREDSGKLHHSFSDGLGRRSQGSYALSHIGRGAHGMGSKHGFQGQKHVPIVTLSDQDLAGRGYSSRSENGSTRHLVATS